MSSRLRSSDSSNMSLGASPDARDSKPIKELWGNSSAAAYGLSFEEFAEILAQLGRVKNYGLAPGDTASEKQQASFFAKLRLSDLMLARACAEGKEVAWEQFLALYREPLVRMATTISGNATQGRDLADALYGDLYGMKISDGRRQSPLNSYLGIGPLMGWMRTLLAQHHVDQHRRNYRETGLGDYDVPDPRSASNETQADFLVLAEAVQSAVGVCASEDRFILKAYYLDGRTLKQIGQLLVVHEATISRKHRDIVDELRKQTLRNIEAMGFSRREAEEALGTDPRDLEANLAELLQVPQPTTFPKKKSK